MSTREAHHDAALVCTRVITSGLDLVDPAQSYDQKLVDTGKGFFSTLSYAHTFWLEHLLSFAALSGGLFENTSWNLIQQLEAFLDKHDQLSWLMSEATVDGFSEHSPAAFHSQPDDRLQFLDGDLDFYPLVAKAVRFRRSLERHSGDGMYTILSRIVFILMIYRITQSGG